MGKICVSSPFSEEAVLELKAGDSLLISGSILVARDAAHRRLVELLAKGHDLPVNLTGQTLYYMGPSPARPGAVIGACGPTTSRRMDRYTVPLLEQGLKVMIGKGERSADIKRAIIKHQSVYLVTLGGAGALLGECVKKAETICYPELGAEAIMRLEVEEFPAFVAYDCRGGDLFEQERTKYHHMCKD
ncbi:MAG: FumA C-terminus/TtdB family hydratase beta subunit [Dehalococcoidales bacterium]|nr:FumA C-terminus/TtdB family hydratase beta subunit [Dehalococcoidales bacterium]MDD4321971.1 FumA C-terminus/TtdB family hydratase beta subunit [Dehalococcoidales bacterium]MDD4794057.1 FumA C-terminus/TtdB family hydratase beta subunit [Dehalococcoidales bacterium]MDD5498198.1 FumA C-terminus/TtdB family hydratase beta subunit [Dehalococcoidales bacterium]